MQGYYTFLSYFNNCSINSVEYNICKAIIENIDNLSSFRVSDLAMLSNTSEPSVKRFWNSLGYNSFQHMKNQIYISYQEFILTFNTARHSNLSNYGKHKSLPEILSRTMSDSINTLVGSYDFKQIDRFSDHLLGNAMKLLICTNIQLASVMLLQALLSIAGKPISAPMFFASQRDELESATANSAVLLCGSARYVGALYAKPVERARANGASVAICIDDDTAPINSQADFNLCFNATNAPSIHSFSFLLDYLAIRYYEQKKLMPSPPLQ